MAGADQHARAGRALLALCGPRHEEARGLDEADWERLDSLAGQHRLQSFLHHRLAGGKIGGIPPAIASGWQEAYRANAIAMLGQRRALLGAVAALGEQGIGAVALKGSALAWTVWPQPAMRPMRDIDLLVAEANAPAAYHALQAAGWEGPEVGAAELEDFARRETHLPPLRSSEGVVCELHARPWGQPPLPGATMPHADAEGLLGRARYNEELGAAVPARGDMLAHLVVHAACSHLLNVGPQALVDIDLLCTKKPIDWPHFRKRAQSDGFERAAALIFALVDRWRRPGFLAETGFAAGLDEDLLAEAELLLVQDLEARKDVSAIASLAAGRIAGRAGQHPLDRAEKPASVSERIGQLAGRTASLGKSLLSPQTRRDGLATARVQKWIEG